jgi:hypothetical protein
VRNISVLYIEGTFASMHQGKNVALGFIFVMVRSHMSHRSYLNWGVGGLSLVSGPFFMHSVTGELGLSQGMKHK